MKMGDMFVLGRIVDADLDFIDFNPGPGGPDQDLIFKSVALFAPVQSFKQV